MAAVPIPPRLIRRSMNLMIAGAVIWTVFSAATTGPNLTGLLLSLQMDSVQIGFVMSLTMLFLPLQMLGAVLQQRYFHRKKFVVVTLALQYLFFAAMAVLVWNWQLLPLAAANFIFLGAFALAQGMTQLSGPVYLAWQSELIPVRDSNTFWTRKQSWSLASSLTAGILIGLLIDFLGRDESATFALIIAGGCVFGAVSLWLNTAPPDPAPLPAERGRPLREALKEIWSNRSYRILVYFFSAWSIANWITSPFIFVYLQTQMGFSMTVIQILTAISGAVGFAAGYLFRILGNKYGRKPVLILCAVLKIVEFVCWGLMLPAWGLPAAIPSFVLGGFVNNGIIAAQFSLLTTTGEKRNYSVAIALFFAITGLCSAGAANLGGSLYQWLCAFAQFTDLYPFSFAPFSFLNPFNILAFISAAGFLLSVFLLPLLHEDGAVPTVQVVRVLLTHNPFRAVYHAHVLSRPLSERHRVETLRAARSSLIAAELIHDLYNPSSRVRAEAVRNIARQEGAVDEAVFAELLKLLDFPELGLQTAAAEALGQRRYAPAVSALCRHAQEGEITFAQVCVLALGQIGGGEAAECLRSVLRSRRRRRLWPEAAEALGMNGGPQDAPLVFAAFAGEDSEVLRRQYLLALARLMVTNREAVHAAFEGEEKDEGTEREKLLRRISGHREFLPSPGSSQGAAFAELRQDCEQGDFAKCLEKLLPPVLAAQGLADGDSGAEGLARQFVAGQLRPQWLQREEYPARSLALLLQLWAKLKYEDSSDNSFLLLTALLCMDALLKRPNRYA